MKKRIFQLAMILMAVVSAGASSPGKDSKSGPAPVESETVIIPFDATKPLAGQKPNQVYVPYERFVELWEAAKATKRGIPPEKLKERYVLGSSRYDAVLVDRALRVKGVIDLQTFGDDWVSVPLPFKQVKAGSLLLDGQPAPFDAAKVVIEKAGPHHIEVTFEIPVKGSNARITWNIPKTAGTLLSVTLPDKQMKAGIQPGNGVVERINGNQKIVTAALGETDRAEIALDSSVGLATMTQAALAKITATLNITPAVELLHAQFDFSFPESQQDHFTVPLDKALSLVKLDVPNLKSWKLSVEKERQVLEIVLTEPARGSFKFSADAERPLSAPGRKFPFLSAAANRIELTAALYSTQDMNVTPKPSDAFRQISFPADGGAGLHLVAAFSGTGDRELLDYEVQPAKLSNKAEISYVYQVNHTKIELVAALKLRPDKTSLFDITLGLPADFVVQAVESGRIKDWWREGDALHVRFKGESPAMTPLVLHLVKLYKTSPDELGIKPLTLPAAWEVEGNGIIAAGRSVKAGMTLLNAKEINPQNAATDFRIMLPMERKRGFSFKGGGFSASVKLETLPARITGEWVMSAQAHESWVSVSTHAKLTARQGSATGVSFKLPAAAPEARVTGENVRETTSKVEEGWRIYRVAFQNELTDETEFNADFDLPGDGKVSLPAFEILDIDRVEGFVIVDNASEYEMQVHPGGLDVAQSRQIPFLPQISRNAKLFRALPGWTLQIDLTRLEKEAGRSAFVAWAELTTAIRADGSEWHRASYHLQNRSLQFLPVKLPAGADLASVSVAGENVRADKGKVDGKDVLLVPLIKTKPGDVSYDVELVYRDGRGGRFWPVSHNTLADPEVVGITVERTLWNLYVPQDLNASGFGGNMQEVLAEVNRTEKLEGMLDELKSLNNLVSSGRNSWSSRNAGDNFKRLAKTLEDSNSANLYDQDMDDVSANKGAFRQQSVDVAAKKREIQEELGRQKQMFESNAMVTDSQQKLAEQVERVSPVQQHAVPQAAAELEKVQQSLQQAQAGLAQGTPTAPVAQSWSANGGYAASDKEAQVLEKAKEVDRKEVAGKKLYINDYVMNVQGTEQNDQKKVTTDQTRVNAGTDYVSRGILQSNVTTNGTMSVTGGTLRSGAALQGNVSLGTITNATGGNGTLQMQQQAVAQLQDAQKQLAQDGAVYADRAEATAMGSANEAMQMATQEAAAGQQDVKVLNNARSNLKYNVTQQQMAMNSAVSAPAAPGAPMAAAAAAKPAPMEMEEAQAKLDEPRRLTISGSSIFAGTAMAVGGGIAAPKPQLQQAGAISLAVDFPTEGKVYHFKKLKANAELTVWITRPGKLERWKWLLVFLGAAAVAKVAFSLIDRSKRIARPVHA